MAFILTIWITPLFVDFTLNRDQHRKNQLADAQSEFYGKEIDKQKQKSDSASSEMKGIKDGTSDSSREYKQARRDFYRAEATKRNLEKDRDSLEKALEKSSK